jgi:hypothetical protein
VRCGRCGNENSDSNRFCGMCGAPLIAKTQATPAAPMVSPLETKAEAAPVRRSAETRIPGNVTRSATEAAPAPAERRERAVTRGPVITGPSFLGLNKPSDGPDGHEQESHSGHAGGSDSWGRSSRNLDYLLEDDDSPGTWGWGKLLAVVIALALVGGFGYLRWKQGGFDWLTNARKPAAAQPLQSTTDTGSPGAAVTPTGANPTAATPDGTASGPAPGGSAAPANGTDAGTQPTTAPDAAPSTAPPSSTAPSSDTAQPAAPAPSAPSPAPAPEASAERATDLGPTEPSQAPAADSEAPASIPAPASKPRVREPKPTPATPVDATAEAERYIYGRGVRQDCDRGVRRLKQAAGSNLKAMISMGVLYSTGTCTPRDLPTAYLWFARALHKQPDNQALQDDLQKLWGQMTQPERQLAIKLSQ